MRDSANISSGFFFPNMERVIWPAFVFLWLWFIPAVLLAQVQPGNFMYDGVNRNYLVFLPQGYGGELDFPVVINLHADTRSAQLHLEYTLMNLVADTAGFIVVYPDAHYFNAANQKSFNRDDINATPPPATPDTRDVGFINTLIDTLDSHYRIDLDRIYACGWTGGGTMSLKLACQLNDRIAAVASVTGELSIATANGCAANRAMPVVIIHGTADPIVQYGGATGWHSTEQTADHWAGLNNCLEPDTVLLPNLDPNDGSTVEKFTYPDGTSGSQVILYKVIGGGHSWPGAAFNNGIGNTNRDINAGVEIWNFFKNYRLSQFIPTGIPDRGKGAAPGEYLLLGNYPNPFNPSTTIKYSVPTPTRVELKIYNALGQLVSILVDDYQTTGEYSAVWEGKDDGGNTMPSGNYFYRIQMGEFSAVRKMTYLK
ncbi:MAG: T9SS type A sorting domain-containing protein [Calditrichaceae bacterium]|nr:T9SS type A sorting domain-containing protein [Calditrichia bacterium]NUQ40858.1 T9SS type A sorting domain-containing protein [Calditrichaceae bacterium]